MILLNIYYPIAFMGYFLIVISFVGFITPFSLLIDVKYWLIVFSFYYLVSFFHLYIGIGLILKKKWVLPIFNLYLIILYICFPVGTIISVKISDYIKKNNIENLFK